MLKVKKGENSPPVISTICFVQGGPLRGFCFRYSTQDCMALRDLKRRKVGVDIEDAEEIEYHSAPKKMLTGKQSPQSSLPSLPCVSCKEVHWSCLTGLSGWLEEAEMARPRPRRPSPVHWEDFVSDILISIQGKNLVRQGEILPSMELEKACKAFLSFLRKEKGES